MSNRRVAVFPGTFDPFTIGHESIVIRALSIFDEIIIAIGSNAQKESFFTLENRMKMISFVFRNEKRIKVQSYEGLTVDFCREVNAGFMLRGIRTAADFEYERAVSQMNKLMEPGIESIMLLTTPEHTPVNSTIVRDIIRHDGDAGRFLPKGVMWKDYR